MRYRKVLLSVLLVTAGTVSVKLAGQSGPASQGVTPPEKRPAEEVYKNIQVLKGLPAEQLVTAMNSIAGSLGVDCDYCHNENFNADDLAAKEKAREMIRMLRRINEENFHAETEVTCFTCHRGQAIPSGIPALGAPQPATEPIQTKLAVDTLPSVDQVLDRYVRALGGQEALDGVRTRILKTAPMGPGGESKEVTEIFQKAPGKALHVMQLQGYATRAGFNGRETWQYDSERSYWGLLDTGQRVSLIQESELYQGSRIRKQYTQVAVLSKEKIGERDVYCLGGISPEGTRERFFFDTQSGLLLRRRTEQKTIFGWVPLQVDFEDYREVDGVKVPFVTRWSSFRSFGLGYHTSRRILEIRQNVPIEDEKFDPPATDASPNP